MYVTQHAAAQFVRRIRPDMAREDARRHLIRAVRSAAPTGERTPGGQAVWRILDPEALLVTKRDPKYGDILVTVLAPGMPVAQAERLGEAEDEVLEAARRMGFGDLGNFRHDARPRRGHGRNDRGQKGRRR